MSDPGEPSDQHAAASTFPRFSALPPELRLQIWRSFAPIDRNRGPRVLSFELRLPEGRAQSVVQPCPSLAPQTAAVRAVLAVNRESRTEARKAYPHTLDLRDGELVVPFHRDLDVVLVDTVEPGKFLAGWERGIRGFTDEVRQLAVGPRYFNKFRLFNLHPGWLLRFLAPFGRLAVVHYTLTACVLDDADCAWCVSDAVHRFHRPETADTAKQPYRLEAVYCWPDLAAGGPRQYAQGEASLRTDGGEYARSQALDDLLGMIHPQAAPPHADADEGAGAAAHPVVLHKAAYSCVSYRQLRRLRKVEYWPMVAFSGISCIRRFRALGGTGVERHPDDSDTEEVQVRR
ncbi:hypothetical protein PG991_001000 [Apiospora marii]|uniref:2EXR domain-containing protein n=1 Tax=Apiospora marii TaxID=335849 RepID=A0ABR1SVC4_9PEZI